MEKALIGITVADESQPVEVLRVIHSYDPCLSCAVHVIKPKSRARVVSVKPRH
jgi:Ni,Fe-hydrogenase I large subunit